MYYVYFGVILCVDLGPFSIRCNADLPGTIKTERWVRMRKIQIANDEMTSSGDIFYFKDIANAVWHLRTYMSKNMMGASLIVDEGMSCQLYPPLLNDLKKLRDSPRGKAN